MLRLTRITWIVLFLVLSALYSLPVVRAQAPTPQAPPSGVDLGLGSLVYQSNFADTKAWPSSGGFAADNSGQYTVKGNGTATPSWAPAASAYAGRDYYAELGVNVESCSGQSALYFLTRMTDPDPVIGNSYALVLQCDGTLVGRRISGGDLRGINVSKASGANAVIGQHKIGVLAIGVNERWFFDGQEVAAASSAAMPLKGHIGLGVSGDMAYNADYVRVWSLAADALPVAVGDTIYDSDFLQDTQWPVGINGDMITRVGGNSYLVNSGGKPFLALSGKVNAAQYVLQMSITTRRCNADASVGVLFHATSDLKDAYAFAIQCNGAYKAGKLDANGQIASPTLTGNTDALVNFGEPFRLNVVSDGLSFRFFVGTKELGSVTASLNAGDVGIYAAPAANGAPIESGINSFTVWALKK